MGKTMREPVKGVLAMVTCCTIWGLSAIYYKLLEHIPPIEILAHRTLWSLAFFAFVLIVQGRFHMLVSAVGARRSAAVIGAAALLISLNWFTFITSIQLGKAVEASLGYYIFPLVSVIMGAIVFKERLGRIQIMAVLLAGLAVTTLTAGLGVAPWIALVLAVSFGLYGVVKKGLSVGPVVSVTAEVLMLAPIAIAVLGFVHGQGGGTFATNWQDSLLLAFSGILTGLPLILFSYATKRVMLSTIGLVQYLNPSLQFLVATLIFGEAFSVWHAIAFGMIWTALALYTTSALHQDRVARRAAMSP
jgi:chloramphenicol-sensitive protein RarD